MRRWRAYGGVYDVHICLVAFPTRKSGLSGVRAELLGAGGEKDV